MFLAWLFESFRLSQSGALIETAGMATNSPCSSISLCSVSLTCAALLVKAASFTHGYPSEQGFATKWIGTWVQSLSAI